jgi:tRNA (guanine-N7-)-methyltransferase
VEARRWHSPRNSRYQRRVTAPPKPKQMPIRYAEMAERLPAEGTIELPSILEGSGDLEIEIGYGLGGFLYERAAAVPSHRIVGIEIKSKLAHKVEQRRIKLGLLNARAFFGDAREDLARSGPDACVARVFVNFPDPWWKKRHAHRRVLDDRLLVDVARLLRDEGELFVQTDVEDRAAQLVAQLREQPSFRLEGDESGYVPTNTYAARSNREVRADADGLPVYRVLARRVAR